MIKILRWSPFLFLAGGLFYFSSQPGNELGFAPFPHWDKFAHFSAFFLIICSLGFALGNLTLARNPRWSFFLIFLFGMVFGILDEWHQSYVPYRDVSFLDWLADITGSAFGVLCLRYYLFRWKQQLRQA